MARFVPILVAYYRLFYFDVELNGPGFGFSVYRVTTLPGPGKTC